MDKHKYIPVQELEIYKIAKELSRIGWKIYEQLPWQDKKIMGDQFIEATDSFGANFVEGYRRFHYLDKNKFYFNARASLAEASDFWIELMFERGKVSEEDYKEYKRLSKLSEIKINNTISQTFSQNKAK